MSDANGDARAQAEDGAHLRIAHLCLPMPGERENGDAVFVRHGAGKQTQLAVIDGLGHGPEAAHASRAALELLASLPIGTSVLDAMQAVHRALRGTRGAAATLCFMNGPRLEICAVGNVGLMSVNCVIPLVVSAGVLGHQVAKFRICGCEIAPRARFGLLSDGVSLRFRLEELKHLDPAQACQFIFDRYRRKEDDATVLIADILS